ncbi:hypothetical protein DENIS_1510 [Desulfonema ishimotonii]|uniref:Uncharacterized protein n=1 Tax=Desulfonema ishimotonii TaxID=45657 RepID=A0A401FUB8_9BACT|nr:hypothetical protein DENIS_1510 [Desulfonema ishimotonii]
MDEIQGKQKGNLSKYMTVRDGRIYFTRDAERNFYFILTLIMMVAGILYKLGLF